MNIKVLSSIFVAAFFCLPLLCGSLKRAAKIPNTSKSTQSFYQHIEKTNDTAITGALKTELSSLLKKLCSESSHSVFCLSDIKIWQKGYLDDFLFDTPQKPTGSTKPYIIFAERLSDRYYLIVDKKSPHLWKIAYCHDLLPKAHHVLIYNYNVFTKKLTKSSEKCPIHGNARVFKK